MSRSLGSSYIGPEHVLLAIAANAESAAGRLLAEARFSPGGPAAQGPRPSGAPRSPEGMGATQSGTPTLDQYGQDLTAAAREGRLDPVVGRADEI